ncbi:glycoside hydrolase family 31 protein [Lentinula aff. detonsa]|nr:glycoside hydrolase family 31 protein [Lentinula aff. detonsa]
MLFKWPTRPIAATAALVIASTTTPGVSVSEYFQPNSTGIKLQNGYERVYIQTFGNHGMRVRTSIMRDPTGYEWSALLDPPLEGPGGNNGLNYDIGIPFQGSATIRNGNIIASVNLGVLSFSRVESNGSTTLLTKEYTDTKAIAPRFYTQDFRSSSFQSQFDFASEPDEQFYGAGQQACCLDNSVNKKGQVVDLINFNSHVTLPVYMSNKGYLQYFNMPSQGRIEFGTFRTRHVASEATVVDYYITTASPGDYDALQEQFTAVTGRQPIPPDFILGYQQSKLRYFNQTQIIDLAQRFHDEQVNVSLIVVDFFAWKFQGDWSFNPEFWPDPEGMAATVRRLTGAEMMVSLWPSMEDLSVNYLPTQAQGLLATTRDGTGISDSFAGVYTRLIDSTNPAAREFLWKRLNDSYYSVGIHNFWIDQADGGTLGEAFENNGQAISQIPYARAFSQYFIGTQEAAGKMYPWFHQQAINEGFANLTGKDISIQCDHMSLTRSTFVGGQRFCSYLWSGDTDSRFDVLLQQITVGVSVAASGISSWTLDIGGFEGLNVDTGDASAWVSSNLCMLDRSCSLPPDPRQSFANRCPNEPWSYGEANFVIIKKYIALRYQLKPYTIMRPLYYDFALSDPFIVTGTQTNDPKIVHQFMMGPRILVAPVGELGATSKEVYLPILSDTAKNQGFTWTHWWTDKDFGTGGKLVAIDAPLDEIPVFYLGLKSDILNGFL